MGRLAGLHSLLEPIILFCSSLLVLSLIVYHAPLSFLQQLLGLLIVMLLLLVRRLAKDHFQLTGLGFRLILIFLSSLFIQLLIFLTGAFYSPFLILVHLLTIVLSFLVSLRVAVSFLGLSVVTLLASSFLDSRLVIRVSQDPWSIIIYLLSFIVLLPLYQALLSRYHLKDILFEILSRQMRLSQLREEHLLGGISDLVLFTDTNLNILSGNEIAASTLSLAGPELTGRPLLDVLFLKDKDGAMIDMAYLSPDRLIKDQTTKIIDNLLLYTKNSVLPKKVNLKITPTANLEGKVDQIIFVLSSGQSFSIREGAHDFLKEAFLRHGAAEEAFLKKLKEKGLDELQIQAQSLIRAEKDLRLAAEIEDHGIKPQPILMDVAKLTSGLILSKQNLAAALKVDLKMVLDEQSMKEILSSIPEGAKFSPMSLTSRYFTVPIDPWWLNVLLQTLLDLSLQLAAGEKEPAVEVTLSFGQEAVKIVILAVHSSFKGVGSEFLSQQNNLHVGSGIEGFLAKAISTLLNIPLKVGSEDSSHFSLTIILNKTSSATG